MPRRTDVRAILKSQPGVGRRWSVRQVFRPLESITPGIVRDPRPVSFVVRLAPRLLGPQCVAVRMLCTNKNPGNCE